MEAVVPYVEREAYQFVTGKLRSYVKNQRDRAMAYGRRRVRRTIRKYNPYRNRRSRRRGRMTRRQASTRFSTRKRARMLSHPAGHLPVSKKKRKLIGERIGSSTCKKEVVHYSGNPVALKENTCYHVNMCYIKTLRTDDDQMRQDKRIKDVINIRGFKFCMTMASTIEGKPLQVNMALISPKKNGKLQDTLHTNQTSHGSKTNIPRFFRDPDGVSRAKDFDHSESSLFLHCASLNTDEINVLFHRKFTLAPKVESTGDSAEGSKSYKQLSFYVPIRRQIRYDHEEEDNGVLDVDWANTSQSSVYLVYWFTRLLTNGPNQESNLNNVVEVQREFTTYFRSSIAV